MIENSVFQEIYKLKSQNFLDFDIHYWRTQSGAEVDFILYKNELNLLPIEIKYRNMNKASISRSLGSFIDAYQPKTVLVITKNLYANIQRQNTDVAFVPLEDYKKWSDLIKSIITND